MRWFHHDCTAKYDPKFQRLGERFGAEGAGIYWGILEELGRSDDSYYLKVIGLSVEADEQFAHAMKNPPLHVPSVDPAPLRGIAVLSAKPLAQALFTRTQRLKEVLDFCAEIDLIDEVLWDTYAVIFSPGFERRADPYAQRLKRETHRRTTPPQEHSHASTVRSHDATTSHEEIIGDVRTMCAQSAENFLPDQKKNQKEIREDQEKQNHGQEDIEENLSTSGYVAHAPDVTEFEPFCRAVHATIDDWNRNHVNRFELRPKQRDLRRLFVGGTPAQREALVYQAMNLLHGDATFPQIILRAVTLMLQASEKKRIRDPFAWIWSCMFGSGNGGTPPWVQLMSAKEEQGRVLRERGHEMPSNRSQPFRSLLSEVESVQECL
jgi:hypothetical protein